MKDEGITERITISISPAELASLDDWRFARRIGSRSEAIRQLIARGLTVPDEGEKPAAPRKKPAK